MARMTKTYRFTITLRDEISGDEIETTTVYETDNPEQILAGGFGKDFIQGVFDNVSIIPWGCWED